MRLLAFACACLATAACTLPADDDGGDDEPLIEVAYGGTYDTAGTWDFSRPFGSDGLGGVVADLLIDEIIALAGVPSSLEGEARAVIGGRIRAPIVEYVNSRVPTEMIASNPTMITLAQILSAVHVDGELVLVEGEDPDRCTGTDVIDNMTVTHEGVTYILDVAEVSGGLASISGGFGCGATGPRSLALGDHDMFVHYGDLVAAVAREALGIDVFALAAQAWANVSCPAVVDTFTAGAGFTVTVAGQDFSVGDAQLEGACDALKAMLEERALGMFQRDAGVQLGGLVTVTGSSVASLPDYDGVITLFPKVKPQITLSFSGQR